VNYTKRLKQERETLAQLTDLLLNNLKARENMTIGQLKAISDASNTYETRIAVLEVGARLEGATHDQLH